MESAPADHSCGASMDRQMLAARPRGKLTALQRGSDGSRLAAGTRRFKPVVPDSWVTAPHLS